MRTRMDGYVVYTLLCTKVRVAACRRDLKHFETELGKFGGDVKMEVHWDTRGLYVSTLCLHTSVRRLL